MKTKVFLAAVAVAFAFAVSSCGNKKAADTTAVDSTAVAVEQCDSTKACCKKDSTACCKQDSTACCKDKAAGECKKACDKK